MNPVRRRRWHRSTAHSHRGLSTPAFKIEPGWDRVMLEAVRRSPPHRADRRRKLGVHAGRHRAVAELRRVRLALHRAATALGRPGRPRRACAPARHTDLPRRDTHLAGLRCGHSTWACKVVNVKVGRFGGITAVQRVHDLCVARGVPMWCGGMLETGIGRAHNIHLATMPGFVYPGDTASASRTYERDITEQRLEATNGIMPVPRPGHRRDTGPGVPGRGHRELRCHPHLT